MARHKRKPIPKELRPLYKQNYGVKEKRLRSRILNHIRFEKPKFWWRERHLLQKVGLILLALLVAWTGLMYGIAQWYINKHANEPLQLGVTFIPSYAEYYGLDAKETMQAMATDLGVKRFRLVSYWDQGEPQPNQYNFDTLDWEFKLAEQNNAKVSLSLGLRQPRWPECHLPAWATYLPKDAWEQKLNDYIQKIVVRYKDSPALDSYQLENEYFLKAFGKCVNFDRDRLVSEYKLVKSIDNQHTLVVSMSNNAIGTPIGQPQPDEYAISVYKRVWDKTLTKRYFEYPIPAWYYAFRAGWVELTRGRNSFIHELQAEPWAPNDKDMRDISVAEQNKSLNARRLKDRFEYGKATGMKMVDMWGAEFWYYRKVKLGDPSLWDTARNEYQGLTNSQRYK
ncbi:MAG: hypothetical protein JWS12_804 [Candidatus Saccharibacteria bacterium]|nr:hypothetical protein [Candidatus Saccharibacteria bacterium]